MPWSQQLEAAVQSFGIGDLLETPVPVSQAWSNTVWRVRTASGAYAIKLFPLLSASRRRALDAGIRFERLVLEDGRIPVPQPIASAGGWLVDILSATGPRAVRCHEWVRGASPGGTIDDEAIVAAGRYLGLLHAMRHPGGDTSQLEPVDLRRWALAVESARQQRLDWAEELAELTPIVEGLAADLEALRALRRPMLISHRDYDPKNTVVDTAGQLVITDWDYAGPVLPGVELIVGATSFASTDEQVVAFVASYQLMVGRLPATDALGMTAELSDLDWLLRNVEACLRDDASATPDSFETARTLITSLSAEVAEAHAWPQRLSDLVAGGRGRRR